MTGWLAALAFLPLVRKMDMLRRITAPPRMFVGEAFPVGLDIYGKYITGKLASQFSAICTCIMILLFIDYSGHSREHMHIILNYVPMYIAFKNSPSLYSINP